MLLVDTNVWLAAADRRSNRHHDCATLLAERRDELAAPVTVVAETSWLLLDRGGPEAQTRFVAMVNSGRMETLDPTRADWERIGELIDRYADLRLDVVDASLIAIAERLGLTTLATLDHRDFAVVRPAHVEAFELLP